MKRTWALISLLGLLGLLGAACVSAPASQPGPGAELYLARCAQCHDSAQERTPDRAQLANRRVDEIVASAVNGSMRPFAEGLSVAQVRAIAEFLSSRVAVAGAGADGRCQGPGARVDPGAAGWRGWGNGLHNSRFQPSPGFDANDIPRLKPKWVYAYDASIAIGHPTIYGDRLFTTTDNGEVMSLDVRTGCRYWSARVGASVRSAIVAGPWRETRAGARSDGATVRSAVYFGDQTSRIHALDADTGRPLWDVRLEQHVAARITGSPVLHGNRLFVPVSSGEEGWARNPRYECCTFRGSLVALDAASGSVLWRTYTTPEVPAAYRRNDQGTQQYGPAGGAIWSAPTIDERRGLIYVATSNSYTDVTHQGSNAIMAIDMADGRVHWSVQVQADDNYVVGCLTQDRAGIGNCPARLGPDFAFGSSPIHKVMPDGREVLLAGRKSGTVYALDPARKGALLWEAQVGVGSPLGGIQWGMTADDRYVYAPVSDIFNPTPSRGAVQPGLNALQIDGGAMVWRTPAPAARCAWGLDRCRRAYSAAASGIPGVVFAGGVDGFLRAYSAQDGKLIWEFDTAAESYPAVNGGEARGGSIDGTGPVIAAGMVFVNSGYGRQISRAGNALIAFSVDGQ